MDWYIPVSHTYLIRRDDDGDHPHVPPCRSRSEDEDQPTSSSQQQHNACLVLYYIEII